jgi:hypothetical protein
MLIKKKKLKKIICKDVIVFTLITIFQLLLTFFIIRLIIKLLLVIMLTFRFLRNTLFNLF